MVSPNFEFLKPHDPQLVRLGTLAEQYFKTDPNTCLIKLRQFGELLAQMVAANVGLYSASEENQAVLLRRLRDRGILKGSVDSLFNELRLTGNKANHALLGDHRTALSHLKYAHQLGIWFYRVFTPDPSFQPGAFIPPPEDPVNETEVLKQELAQLRAEVKKSRSEAEFAQIAAQQEAQLRLSAEELAKEAQAKAQEALTHLAQMQTLAVSHSAETIEQTVCQAQQAEAGVVLDERETRRLIDGQLRAAGWEVDSEELIYQQGTRPQKGRNLAIAEWPTARGRADYALFVGWQVVAVVEAKRQSQDVSGAIDQAKRYSRDYQIKGNETLCVHQNHLIRVRLSEILKPEFIEAYWNSPQGRAKVFEVAHTTTGPYTLSVSKIARLSVPLAPEAEQIVLQEKLDKLFQIEAYIQASMAQGQESLNSLNQSILAKAFRGELVPQDPNDEPASVLLERIRAEPEKLNTNGKTKSKTEKKSRKTKPEAAEAEQLHLPGLEQV